MDKVFLASCRNYEKTYIKTAVSRCLDGFGGARSILNCGKRRESSLNVLIKPNLIKAARVEDAATTHPEIIEAIAAEFCSIGANVSIGDCPATPQSRSAMESLYKITGMESAAKNSGADLIYDFSSTVIKHQNGCKTREFSIWNPVFDADIIINCAKLKTHSFAVMTGAVKNMFGILPGLFKSAKHAENMNILDFSDMIVDLFECAKNIVPIFSFIDGIVGMEGKGPTGGDAKLCGVIITSDSAYAADIAGITVMGMKPMDVPIIECAAKRELCAKKLDEITLMGDNINRLIVPFIPAKKQNTVKMMLTSLLPKGLKLKLRRNNNPYPKINRQKCVKCRKCIEICPVQAATAQNGEININSSLCIRCYCCHEVCPKRAIDL